MGENEFVAQLSGEKLYMFPSETLPGLDLVDHLSDLKALSELLIENDIQTANTRVARYIRYLNLYNVDAPFEEEEVFKESSDGRFKSGSDWFLYVLREVHELIWIYKGLRVHYPVGVTDKLRATVSGRDFSFLVCRVLNSLFYSVPRMQV